MLDWRMIQLLASSMLFRMFDDLILRPELKAEGSSYTAILLLLTEITLCVTGSSDYRGTLCYR